MGAGGILYHYSPAPTLVELISPGDDDLLRITPSGTYLERKIKKSNLASGLSGNKLQQHIVFSAPGPITNVSTYLLNCSDIQGALGNPGIGVMGFFAGVMRYLGYVFNITASAPGDKIDIAPAEGVSALFQTTYTNTLGDLGKVNFSQGFSKAIAGNQPLNVYINVPATTTIEKIIVNVLIEKS